MEGLKSVPKKGYWLLLTLIDMIMLFIYSIFNLTKPSDSLSRDDIDSIRRNRSKRYNGNDMNYKGKRGSSYVPLGGWGGGWIHQTKQASPMMKAAQQTLWEWATWMVRLSFWTDPTYKFVILLNRSWNCVIVQRVIGRRIEYTINIMWIHCEPRIDSNLLEPFLPE